MSKRTKSNKASGGEASKKPLNPAVGVGCLVLFALPFAAVGVFMSGSVVRDLWAYQEAKSWVATPATLLAADLKLSKGSKGGTTYRATARYRYVFAGKTFENDRVALHTSADNVGDYQRRRGEELKRLQRAGEPIIAYVDPDDPARAMLYRDLRPGMVAVKGMAGLLFGGVGFGLIGGSVWGGAKLRRESQRSLQFPDEPWRWKEEWESGRLRSSGAKAWASLIFAAFWNLISWPMIALALTSDEVAWPALLIAAIFPLVGVGLAIWACYSWMQRLKWGVSELELATLPGVLGGPLAGIISVPKQVRSEKGIVVKLACLKSVTNGKQKSEVPLWEEEHTIVRDLSTDDGLRTLIPAQFVIPYELPDSNSDNVKWKLMVDAPTDGVDYHAEFEVPVFKTAASSRTPSAFAAENSELFAATTLATLASGARARVDEDFPDRKILYFSMGRHLGMSTFLTLFTLGCLAVAVGLALSDAPRFFAWVFGGVAALMALITVTTVFESARLQFGIRGVAIARRVAGFGTEQRFEPREIARVTAVKSGMTYGSTVYWNVELHDRRGKRHKLATAIPRRQLAERLAEEIAAAVGLSTSRSDSQSSRMDVTGELPPELRRG
jgi:hypothetical protein